jgi:hypothetical protein
MNLLSPAELPDGWQYPRDFLDFVSRASMDLEPWFILEGKLLRDRCAGLQLRYPNRRLVPFARRQDNDDVACWDLVGDGPVAILHDFSDPGWEQREWFPTFTDWLERARQDHEEFASFV